MISLGQQCYYKPHVCTASDWLKFLPTPNQPSCYCLFHFCKRLRGGFYAGSYFFFCFLLKLKVLCQLYTELTLLRTDQWSCLLPANSGKITMACQTSDKQEIVQRKVLKWKLTDSNKVMLQPKVFLHLPKTNSRYQSNHNTKYGRN